MSLPHAPKAVVFDLDGTLIDSEALVRDAYRHTSALFGVEMSDAQFLSLVGLNRDDNDATLLTYWGADFPLADFHEANRRHLLEQTAALKAGVIDLLDFLDAREIPYALATSSGPLWVGRHFGGTQWGIVNSQCAAQIVGSSGLGMADVPEPSKDYDQQHA